jgi:(4-(4-[2-(gamma-L-glutamylamino)ethyl]phenoxymethyl)furan-2-yl)methanamine synthase
MMASDQRPVIGWDIGGAHLKGALLEDGRVRDVAQWPCELWRGMPQLADAFESAFRRWTDGRRALHAVTMTGEMADLFEHREAGVAAIVSHAAATLGERTSFYAGGVAFLDAPSACLRWRRVASVNWLATATIVARSERDALLVDVGSTTTDIVPIVTGRVVAKGSDDATRLAAAELVYVGVVRTPLCALAGSVPFDSARCNVMNELFATTADVFRLTGELRAEHDQSPAADQGAKDAAATMRRLARMIGRDGRDGNAESWHAFARVWRQLVVDEISTSVVRVEEAARLPHDAVIVGAGCGSFIAQDIAAATKRRQVGFDDLAPVDPGCSEWARTCAPAVAVALLRSEADRCGS